MPPHLYTQEHVDLTLREGRCGWISCYRLFYICRHCDHGQIYCSEACRASNQKRLRAQANRRHQQSREGRRDHADRQRAYRERKKVTDHGRPALEDLGKLCSPEENSRVAILPTPSSSAMKVSYEPTVLCDSSVARENPPIFALGEPGNAACDPTSARRCPSHSRLCAPRGALAVGEPSTFGCALCGRRGRFVSPGPLRRIRVRTGKSALLSRGD